MVRKESFCPVGVKARRQHSSAKITDHNITRIILVHVQNGQHLRLASSHIERT